MLERRPDLIAAERRVAAAFNRIGEARAARLPSIRLTGNVGWLDSGILELKQDYDNPSAGVGAKFVAPLYTGGALEAQVEIRTVEQKEAVAQYARTALRAIGDVETILATAQALSEREVVLQRALADNERSLELAGIAYRVGTPGFTQRAAAAGQRKRCARDAPSGKKRTASPAREPASRARRKLRAAAADGWPLTGLATEPNQPRR